MSETPVADPNHQETRKTVSFTHKQLGWSGGIIASLALVSQLKGAFITREEGTSQNQQLAELKISTEKGFTEVKSLIIANNEDLTHKLERSNDKHVERIKDEESRRVEAVNGIRQQIDIIMQAVLPSHSRTKTN